MSLSSSSATAGKWIRNYVPHKHTSDILVDYFSLRCAPLHINDISAEKHILMLNRDYLCINKPPDVRMDGDFDVTIEKLCRKWLHDRNSPHVHINDDSLSPSSIIETKWIHQLDFSTSGCLLIGLHKTAASLASQSFENRTTYKEYIAVVEGSLIPSPDWPVLVSKLEETKSKRIKVPKRKAGYDVKNWQDQAILVNLQNHLQMLHDLNKVQADKTNEINDLLSKYLAIPFDNYTVNNKLRKELRKYLKSQGCKLVDAGVELLAKEQLVQQQNQENVSKQEQIEGSKIVDSSIEDLSRTEETRTVVVDSSESCVPVSQVQEDEACHRAVTAYRVPDMPVHKFYLNIPIAEVSDSFLMEPGTLSNPGLWSGTLFEVLAYCTYQGRNVTKVRLVPQTGRRHQLRVHCKFLGHPIVGDATYCPEKLESMCNVADRMMLHSHILQVALPSSDGLLSSMGNTPSTEHRIEITAADPFIIDSNNKLQVDLPSFVLERQKHKEQEEEA